METTTETMTKTTDSMLRAMLQKSWGVGLHAFDHIYPSSFPLRTDSIQVTKKRWATTAVTLSVKS